jgi:hypothetical protein
VTLHPRWSSCERCGPDSWSVSGMSHYSKKKKICRGKFMGLKQFKPPSLRTVSHCGWPLRFSSRLFVLWYCVSCCRLRRTNDHGETQLTTSLPQTKTKYMVPLWRVCDTYLSAVYRRCACLLVFTSSSETGSPGKDAFGRLRLRSNRTL